MATFIAVPLALQQQALLPKEEHWWVYLAALLISFFGMVPFIIYAEKQRQMKRVVLGAVAVLVLVQPLFWLSMHSLPWLVATIVIFFIGFNLLEATLPSLLSKIAPAGGKGTAMGVYSTSQFAGAALGGLMGGWMFGHFGLPGVFIACGLLALSWWVIGVTMNEPPYVTSYRLALSAEQVDDTALSARLLAVPGVAEAIIVAEDAAAYLKVDTKELDREALDRVVAPV